MRWRVPVVLVLLLIQVGCRDRPKTEFRSANGSTLDIPALFERRGELASAIEWQRTREKVTELNERIKKNPGEVKPRLQIAMIYLAEARVTGSIRITTRPF